jgi:hypothetical protein
MTMYNKAIYNCCHEKFCRKENGAAIAAISILMYTKML